MITFDIFVVALLFLITFSLVCQVLAPPLPCRSIM